jgi:hypothetical protein
MTQIRQSVPDDHRLSNIRKDRTVLTTIYGSFY